MTGLSPTSWGANIKTTEDLIETLSKSMRLLSYFFVDRDKVIDGTAIPAAEKATLKSGDAQAINELLSRYLPTGTRKRYGWHRRYNGLRAVEKNLYIRC